MLQAYIFDFGAELYVWTGKHVPFDKRKKILQLALELWNTGYNYSEFDINPFAPLVCKKHAHLIKKIYQYTLRDLIKYDDSLLGLGD